MTTRKASKRPPPKPQAAKQGKTAAKVAVKPAKATAATELRGWQFAAAAAAHEAAESGCERIDDIGFEAELARPYLKRVLGTFPIAKKPTWRLVAQSLWGVLGCDHFDEWTEGERVALTPYHFHNVTDPKHYLYDPRGHASTDPKPGDFVDLVDGIEAVGWVMQGVHFTEEKGIALTVDGRRRVRGARAVNLRRLNQALGSTDNPKALPPVLIESIPGTFLRDKRRIVEVKNGINYHRSSEDALRQMAGIQELEGQKIQPGQIARMFGVTTQTIANLKSLANLSTEAKGLVRADRIGLNLAYRLARELPKRQDDALAATKTVAPKARQRAIEAFLAGENPAAEARAWKAKDVRAIGRRVAENTDPELAPLRALFAVLRGNVEAVAELPPKWRGCLGIEETLPCPDPIHQLTTKPVQTIIDDGVPLSMRVPCPKCEAEPAEYCLGDDDDEQEDWANDENTRVHAVRQTLARGEEAAE